MTDEEIAFRIQRVRSLYELVPDDELLKYNEEFNKLIYDIPEEYLHIFINANIKHVSMACIDRYNKRSSATIH